MNENKLKLKIMNLTNDPKNLIGGFIAGAAVGIAIECCSPMMEEDQQQIVDGSVKLKDNLVGSMHESIDKLKEQFNTKIDQMAKKQNRRRTTRRKNEV